MNQGGQGEDSRDKDHAQAGTIVCHECDLLQQVTTLPRGGSLLCARCDAPLRCWVDHGLDRPLALALTAAVSFLIGNIFPVMTLEFQAQRIAGSMLGSVWQMHTQGETVVGLLVFVTAVLAPAALICLLLWLLLPLRFGFGAPGFAPLFRLLMAVSSWAMVEVLMVGIVVSLVKLGHEATADVGIGLWAYGVTMLLLTLLSSSLQGEVIWRQYERVMALQSPAGMPAAELPQ